MKFILTQSASAAKAYREFRAFPASEHSDIPWVTLFNLYQSQVYLYQFFVGNKMFRNFMKKVEMKSQDSDVKMINFV